MNDICFVCNEGNIVQGDDEFHVKCDKCLTVWAMKGHEKPIEDRI